MVSKLFLISIFLILFPMMAIPYYPLKIPPIYQIINILLTVIVFLFIIHEKKIKKNYLEMLILILLFDIYLVFIKSSLSQIVSINFYLLVLISLRYYLKDSIFKNIKKINNILFFIYIIMVLFSFLQIIIYKLFGTLYLIDYHLYLTSEINSIKMNNPVSGWNEDFRPTAFFSEPSFLSFYIAIYTIYAYENNKKYFFIIMNIILLHLFGSRSGELVLIVMVFYILLENLLGSKKTLTIASLLGIIFFIVLLINMNFLSTLIDEKTMDFSTYERLYLLFQGIDMFLNNLYVGVGLGNLKDIFSLNELYERDISNVGNLYIQMLAEIGIIGFSFLIVIMKRQYSYSLTLITLLLSIMLVGAYNLLYMWLLPLFMSIYKEHKIASTISK